MAKRLTPEQVVLRAVTEAQFQAQVVDLLALNGYDMVMHMADSRKAAGGRMIGDKGTQGWPDLFAIRTSDGDRLAIELKRETGRVRPNQMEWLEALRRAGIDAYLWRPSDIPEITQRLRRGRKEAPDDGSDARLAG